MKSTSVFVRYRMNEFVDNNRQRIPPRPRPVLSTPYVPTAGHSEANSVHSTSLSDHDVAGDLASSAG